MLSDETIQDIMQVVHERDWEQFHSADTLAKSICIEASELLECFQWSSTPRNDDMEHVADELADVFTYCIELAALLNLDIDSIVRKKLVKTQHKYPVTQAKGKSNKYRKLQ